MLDEAIFYVLNEANCATISCRIILEGEDCFARKALARIPLRALDDIFMCHCEERTLRQSNLLRTKRSILCNDVM